MRPKYFLLMLSLIFLTAISTRSQVVDTTTLNANISPIGVTGTLTLDSTKIYKLTGFFFVQSGGTINIPSGTIIRGDKNSKGSLIVLRGGKIFGRGTSTRPIVFTSNLAVGSRASGDWGGVILIGKATINTYTGADTSVVEGVVPDIYYGGHDDNDNSGVLQYCRIEYAGIALSPNNEINGLSMYSVGRGTTIDHIMVSYSGDDSFEWFGGTVNMKYLIAWNGLDDDMDDSYGFRGRVQFVVGVRTPGIADVSGSKFWESDNNEFVQGSSTVFNANNPRTQSIFANVTSIGPKEFDTTTVSSNFTTAIHERRYSLRACYDGVFIGWNKGYRLDGPGCILAAQGDTIKFISNILAGIGTGNNFDTVSAGGQTLNPTTWGMDPAKKNDTLYLNSQAMLTNPYSQNRSTANFIPLAGSPVFNNTTDPSTVDPFFTSTNYRGAFGTTDWGLGWQNWRPDTVNYSVLIGIQPISTVVPSNFSLEQNYPNPFNPSTAIKFDVKSSGLATLKIYDIIGREVATLVNENVSAGTYKINFDASNLPSGVYFYKLNVSSQSSEWTQTKKMMLVK